MWNAIHFVDDRTYVLGSARHIKAGIDRGQVTEVSGPLAPALAEAAKKHHLVGGVKIDKKWAIPFLRTIGEPTNNYGIMRALARWEKPGRRCWWPTWGRRPGPPWNFTFPMRSAGLGMDAVQDGLTLIRILLVDHAIALMEEEMERCPGEEHERQVLFGKVVFQEIEPALCGQPSSS